MLLFLVSLIFCQLTAADQIASKDDCFELNVLWNQKYHSDFNVKWKKADFNCPSDQSRIAAAFFDLDKIKFYKNEDGFAPDFYAWAKQHIRSFLYQPKYLKNIEVKLRATTTKEGIVTIYDYFVKDKDRLNNVTTLIHETRHATLDDPGHEPCRGGLLEGALSCDAKFYESGESGSGYNYAFKFYRWFRNASFGHDLEKEVAEYKMSWSILNHFNEVSNKQVQRFCK